MPGQAVSRLNEPLPAPPADAAMLAFGLEDLPSVRVLVAERAREAGMDRQRRDDLVLVADELACNSIRHGGGIGELRVWREAERIVCEVKDAGHITDPLVGRRRPPPDAVSGRGLWLAHQLCDLVQIESSHRGTRVRATISVRACPR